MHPWHGTMTQAMTHQQLAALARLYRRFLQDRDYAAEVLYHYPEDPALLDALLAIVRKYGSDRPMSPEELRLAERYAELAVQLTQPRNGVRP